MTERKSNFPVLILGTYLTALGTIRSLGAAGIRAYCITEQQGFVRSSRWSRRPPHGCGHLSDPAELATYLRTLPLKRAVLMTCGDEWVQAVATLEGELSDRFMTSQPSPETVGCFLDKGRFEQRLEALQIDRPRSLALRAAEDLARAPVDKFGVFFLKPRHSRSFFKHYRVKAFMVQSLEDAMARYRETSQAGFEMMLQEYIPGPASSHFFIDGFIDRHQSLRTILSRQRLRMYPDNFGDSSYMVSIPLETVSDAVADLRRLLADVTYRGIFSAEFKRCEHDGRFKLIEVNTRPWAYIEFATLCGANIAEMAYRDALGLDVPEVQDYKIGVCMVHLPNDFAAARNLYRLGETGVSALVLSWLKARSTVFSWSDPIPALVWWGEIVFARFRRLMWRRK